MPDIAGQQPEGYAPCPYGLCDGRGLVLDFAANAARDCRCRADRAHRLRNRAAGRGMPRAWQGASLDRLAPGDYDPLTLALVRDYVAELESRMASGTGLWLLDQRAGGERATDGVISVRHSARPPDRAVELAAVIAETAWRRRRTTVVASLDELLSSLRGARGEGARAYERRLQGLREADLLVLWGLERALTEGAASPPGELLLAVLGYRYDWLRPTVVTSRVTPDALAVPLGPSAVGRLLAACGDPLPAAPR